MAELCYYLRRSERSCWRYIADAKSKGYFRRCEYADGIFTIEYRGLKSLTRHLGLESIGMIGEVPLVKIQHAKVFATDLATIQLQSQSDFKRKQEVPKTNRHQLRGAAELLDKDSPSARVPGGEIYARGKRLLYLLSGWIPFGASQKGIAEKLGCSTRTIQNRLSNAWREERGIPHLTKLQTAHEVIKDCPADFLKTLARAGEDTIRLVRLGRHLFEAGCNLYDIPIDIRNQRYRQREHWVEQVAGAIKPDEAFMHKGARRRSILQKLKERTIFRAAPQTLHCVTGGGASNLSSKVFEFPEEPGASPNP